MKKVGIITIHRINNYGAVEQAYALNKYLNNQGIETQTIDFRTYRVKESYQLYAKVHSIMDIIRNFQAFIYRRKSRNRNRRFCDFIKNNIAMTSQTYYSNKDLEEAELEFDYYICGSDQVWNTYCRNYDDAFILSFAKEKGKRISYAASMGAANINEKLLDKFKKELKGYQAISVRESNAVDVIKEISGKEVYHVVDPVFLLEADEWREVSARELIARPYIFFYFVHGDIPGMRDYVKRLSREKDMPVVVVNINLREMQYKNIKCYDAGPAEFLSLIDHAEYICTNSFHACAFSIIFKKKFVVFTDISTGRGATSSRIYSILSSFGLNHRVGSKDDSLEKIEEDINYDEVYKKLSPMIIKSKKFLNDAVGGDKNS